MHGTSVLLRQFDVGGKGSPLSGLAFDQKPAPMAINDVLDDGQTQAGAAPFVAHFALDTKEPLPQARQKVAGHSRTAILNPDVGVGSIGGGGRRQERNAAGLGPA